MSKTIVVFLCALVAITTQNVVPSLELPKLSPQDLTLLETYQNFTMAVAKSIADNDIEMDESVPPHPQTVQNVEPACAMPSVQVSSAFGLTHVLATVDENIWKIGVPVFEELFKQSPKTLPDAFEFIFKDFLADPDVTFSSALFTSKSPSMTPALKKLKVDVVNTDLSTKDAANTVNNYLNKFIGTPLEENYIPKDASISPAATAMLIDTLHVSEDWSSPATKVSSPSKFNGIEPVDMIEIKGSFQVMENEQALEVLIPFKNAKRALSLVLPNDLEAFHEGNLGEPKVTNYTTVRVQIPILKSTVRNSQVNLTTKCNFKKNENFLQLSDHLLSVSLALEKFNAISITGAQIANVEKFKSLKINNQVTDSCLPSQNVSTSAVAYVTGSTDPKAEKLIVFNRPFSWTLLDRGIGAIFSGSVLSTKADPTHHNSSPFVFGLDSQLSYAKCL